MQGTRFAPFSAEVLRRGAAAVLPQHLPDRWLDALLEEAVLFAPGEGDPEEGDSMHECCAGLLGAVLVVLMEQRDHPDQLEVAVSTLMSHLSNRRRWRTFLTRSARSGADAASPRGLKRQPSEGSINGLALCACVTVGILEVAWRVLWKVLPRSWRASNNSLSHGIKSGRGTRRPCHDLPLSSKPLSHLTSQPLSCFPLLNTSRLRPSWK